MRLKGCLKSARPPLCALHRCPHRRRDGVAVLRLGAEENSQRGMGGDKEKVGRAASSPLVRRRVTRTTHRAPLPLTQRMERSQKAQTMALNHTNRPRGIVLARIMVHAGPSRHPASGICRQCMRRDFQAQNRRYMSPLRRARSSLARPRSSAS